jgi:opacity protein-like surface antigen
MIRFQRIGTLLLSLSLLGGSAAWAQYRGRDVSFSVFFGYDVLDLTDALSAAKMDLPPRQAWGVSLELTPLSRLGFEVSGFMNPNDMDVGTVIVGYDFNHWYWMGSAVVRLRPTGTFNPYLLVGGGLTVLRPQTGDSVSRPTLQVGAGFDIFASPHWALRVDGRLLTYRFRAADFSAQTLADTRMDPTFDRRLWQLVLSAGIRWKQ